MRKGRTPTPGPTSSAKFTPLKAIRRSRVSVALMPRGTGGPLPAGQLLMPVMRELFAKADALEDGEE